MHERKPLYGVTGITQEA